MGVLNKRFVQVHINCCHIKIYHYCIVSRLQEISRNEHQYDDNSRLRDT